MLGKAGEGFRWGPLDSARRRRVDATALAPPVPLDVVRYSLAVPAAPTPSPAAPGQVDDDDRALLVAVAEGLADDAAGRVMDTETLKDSLEQELGPISWP